MDTSRDWMFCPITGTLLDLEAVKGVATCPVCGFQRSLQGLQTAVSTSHTNMEDYRRRHNLDPVVKTKEDEELMQARARATVDEPCPRCGHMGLEYYTMQLRSADEGQTVFYECPECAYRYSQNT